MNGSGGRKNHSESWETQLVNVLRSTGLEKYIIFIEKKSLWLIARSDALNAGKSSRAREGQQQLIAQSSG